MNCYKYTTIKSGTIKTSFSFKFTDTAAETDFTISVNESAPLNMGLTYKDICRIKKGAFNGPDGWALRGPECTDYHTITGEIYTGWKEVGKLGHDGPSLFVNYDLFGCSVDIFSGRLNAYGRRAKKAFDNAPPPDPDDGPSPCETDGLAEVIRLNDPENPSLNEVYPSAGIDFKFGNSLGVPYTYTQENWYYKINNPTPSNPDDPFDYKFFILEVTGIRDIQNLEFYGDL
jgi:hypothetical protein